MTPASGSGITTCSVRCSAASWPGPSRTSCPSCTSGPAPGTAGRVRRTRRSATRCRRRHRRGHRSHRSTLVRYVDCGQVATVRGWLNSLGDGIVSASRSRCTARRGPRPCPATRIGCGAGCRSSKPVREHDGPLPGQDAVDAVFGGAAQRYLRVRGLGPMRDAANTRPSRWKQTRRRRGTPWPGPAYAGALYWSGEPGAAFEQAQAGLVPGNGSVAIVRIIGLSALSFIAADRGEGTWRRQSSARGIERAKSWKALARGGRRSAAELPRLHSRRQRSSPGAGGWPRPAANSRARLGSAAASPGSRHGPPWRSWSGWRAPVLLEPGDRPGSRRAPR